MSAVSDHRLPATAPEPTAPGAVFGGDLVLTSDHSDQSVRWTPGERLNHVFEATCDRLHATGDDDRLAVSRGDLQITYAELDARANRLARFLRSRGVLPGDRVGLVFDDPVWGYAGMLAVLKVHAAYVPLDAGFPPDRMAFIVEDAQVSTVLTLGHLVQKLTHAEAQVLALDEQQSAVDRLDGARLQSSATGRPADELSYVIYTSGTTGRPKGVPIEHAAIVNFVRVAAEVYGVRPDDRMYQGLTLAFDFSVEEIWVAWAVGATLVPKPGANLLGEELARFLRDERVTALCCVPTLLATMDDDLPDLRFLLVSGEACPQDLVARWHRPGRRFLNTYGPTEATVTATWTTVEPDQRVTIGVPLPTYSVVILAEDSDTVLPRGEQGEIAIGGVCLSPGYLNRADATARAFVPDPVGVPNNPSGQVYRTGDLGRITDGERIEYLGRIDTQVKIRGYRIELTEIESLLLRLPGVAQAVVDTHRPGPGAVELVAYYTQRPSGPLVDADAVFGALRERLPSYMVPAYLERLDTMPMLPSDKVDRKNLPAPRGPRRVERRGAHVPAEGAAEEALAGAIGGLLGIDDVSVEGHFFEELGLNSLMLAQLRNRLRNHATVPAPTTQDMYRHPTVRSLAAVLGTPAPRTADRGPREVYSAPRARYLLTGVAQAGLYAGFAYLLAFVGVTGYGWLAAGTGLLDVYVRSVTVAGATLALLTFLPVAVKWLLVGRFEPGVIPIWGLRYLRFWLVRQLLRTSPAMLFVGSPVYGVYLRLLGAKVGPGAVVQSTSLPVCADLITIGAGAVIRKDSHFSGYRAEAGLIRTGPVTIGADALVGEATVLDIDTEIGDSAQLGHTSSLQVGQRVPAGARWHGSPARETGTDYRTVATGELTRRRRLGYSVLQILGVLLGWGPIATGIAYSLLPAAFPGVSSALGLAGAAGDGGDQHEFADPAFYLQHFLIAGALLFGAGLAGILVVTTVARLLGRAVAAGVTYPLYGWRYSAHRAARRLGNIPFFHNMLGDSSYIVGYLRAIGYDLSRLEQTGSNFGLALKHDSAVRTHVGTGTLVSDGLSIVNADYSRTSFTVSDVSVGSRSFFGNAITYPAQGRTGDDCLLGTKVMVPVDGPVRSGIGLLGSPSFEIPRSVQRDVSLDHYRAGPEFRTRLAAKNRHNATTIGTFLLLRWLQVFGITLIGLAATDFYDEIGISAYAAAVVAVLLFTTLSSILAERLAMGFRRLAPRFCSIYDPYFWTHERLWKLSGTGYLQVFNGTPFKSLIWRLLGVRVGRQLFDDGVAMPEKTMVTIGDHCTLGADSTIQCHSLEDGSFKSDRTVLGDGVTVGAHTYVHYGVRMGDRTVLDPDAFLMKGEEPAADTRWRGNPAVETAGESVVEIPAPRSGAVTAGEPVTRTTGRVPAALAVAALSVLAVVQVLLAALRLPAGSAEATLVDGAFALVRGLPWPVTGDLVARVQVAGYAAVTGAFERHADVLTGARELAVLAAAVTVAALVVAAWRLRVRPAAVVVVLALLAVCPPAVEALAAVGPGPLGVMWLTLGAALLTGGHRVPRVLGVVAVVLAVATAPVLAVAPAAVIAVAAARRRPGIAVAAGLAGITALLAAWLPAGPVGSGIAPVLAGVAVLAAAGGFALRGLRGPAAGVAVAALLAALPWPGAGAAQAGLVVAVAALGTVLVAEVLVLAAGYGPALRRSVAGVAAAAWVALLAVLGAGPPPVATTHGALAAWLGTASDPTVQVSVVGPGLWADLVRDGVPVQRLAADGRLVVGTAAPTAADLARFGALTVTDRGSGTAGASGSELADNPRLLATPAVRETLRSGTVDIRTLAVLAGLTSLGPVAVSDLPALPGETAALPRHVVVLGPVDAATLGWLRAQQPPFAPTITGPTSGITLSWPVPAPTALGG